MKAGAFSFLGIALWFACMYNEAMQESRPEGRALETNTGAAQNLSNEFFCDFFKKGIDGAFRYCIMATIETHNTGCKKMVKVASFGTKKALSAALVAAGVKGSILSIGNDAKTVKGEKVGYKTGIVYMTPDRELCPASKAAACEEGCLNTSGRAGIFATIPAARSAKSALFKNNPGLFFSALIAEIGHYSAKFGESFVVRLNGTSDIAFEDIALEYKGIEYSNIFEIFPDVQFYDYTKRVNRAAKVLPANYDLTLSYSGARSSYAESVLKYANAYGKRVAVVFAGGLPETFHNMPVVDGDETDLRFLEPGGVIVGLKAKGKARKDNSGFVVRHAGLIAVA